jgi:DNA polymerase-3 subunit delta'
VSWQRVRGHDALIAAFRRVMQRGRLAHAYLFVGPPGVGKRLFADELAKALLCEAPRGVLEACDQCDACRQVEAGTHPDLFVAARPEDSQAMPRDVMLELRRSLALKPARGHGKIAVVDDADDLHDPITGHAAANCFLKTLEEPPPGSLLLLVGTSSDLQLPTIVSRCQVVTFAPLPDDLVGELLRAQGVEDEALLGRLVRLGHGSPGQARALADPALWAFRRTLLDGLSRPQVESVALAKQWAEFVEEAGKESAAQRRRAALAVHLLVEFLTNALAFSVGGTPELAEPEDQRALEALVQRADPDRLLDLLERCLEADAQIDRRVQLSLLLEALLDALGQRLRQGARW